jgi:hypothetical protein
MATKKSSTKSYNLLVVIIPAIITALAGIVGSYLSYSAGINTVRIPLNATQTAEAKETPDIIITTKQNIDLNANVRLAIDSQSGWQPSGIYVNTGDKINISAVSGAWATSGRFLSDEEKALLPDDLKGLGVYVYFFPETKGDGIPLSCTKYSVANCPLPDNNLGMLVARIGFETPVPIGTHSIITALNSGNLYLNINDGADNLQDNSGVLGVLIIVEKP